jgi:L-alanine-DL-glutamate epimerase-like enolase superfamily enzyme
VKIAVETVRLSLRRPLVAAWGTLAERELVQVTVTDRDGLEGHGEAAALEPYDGVAPGAVRAALDAYSAVLGAAPPGAGPEELVAACRSERDLPQALAAIDLALWDLEGRRAGAPVHALLHPRGAAASVPVNAVIGADDRAGAAAEASTFVAAGYRTLKVKVGVGDDAGRVAAVRAAAPHALIRVDANGAWATPQEALAHLRALAPVGLELAEEPVHGVGPLRAVRSESPVPIAMDETAAEPGASSSGATDAVCLKIARCGGISGLLREALEARAAGSAVYVASTFDGPLGIAAALHAAAALSVDGVLPACGLATLDAFAGVESPFGFVDGAMVVPFGPGLGAEKLGRS